MAHRMTDGITDGLACVRIFHQTSLPCATKPQGTQCRTLARSKSGHAARKDSTGMIGVDEIEGFLLDGLSDVLAPVSILTGQ